MTLPENKPWWNYIESDLRELWKEACLLLEIFEKNPQKFRDYSFIVFPAAKAYEGFLKKLFLDMGFITDQDYRGKRFRIGKALNPFLDEEMRNESIYDKLVDYCGGKRVADRLWETWKLCRNLVFHWFPEEKNAIDLAGAEERLEMIVEAIDAAVAVCKINFK